MLEDTTQRGYILEGNILNLYILKLPEIFWLKSQRGERYE